MFVLALWKVLYIFTSNTSKKTKNKQTNVLSMFMKQDTCGQKQSGFAVAASFPLARMAQDSCSWLSATLRCIGRAEANILKINPVLSFLRLKCLPTV